MYVVTKCKNGINIRQMGAPLKFIPNVVTTCNLRLGTNGINIR